MDKKELFSQIKSKKSFLCVGLDTDIHKIPPHLLAEEDPVFEFNRQIIDATAKFAVAYKINTAFYEALGYKGWLSMEKTLAYIPKDILTIADAKRGDIGNTGELYAKAFFETIPFDAITVAPYMGQDSVQPFLNFPDKWVILLALTSNTSSADFQFLKVEGDKNLFEKVIEKSLSWQNSNRLMYVVGATQTEMLAKIRKIIPDHFLLVPGVGAQGGDLEEVAKYGMNSNCGLLVNASRAIIYAGNDGDFAKKAGDEAKKYQQEMELYLDKYLYS